MKITINNTTNLIADFKKSFGENASFISSPISSQDSKKWVVIGRIEATLDPDRKQSLFKCTLLKIIFTLGIAYLFKSIRDDYQAAKNGIRFENIYVNPANAEAVQDKIKSILSRTLTFAPATSNAVLPNEPDKAQIVDVKPTYADPIETAPTPQGVSNSTQVVEVTPTPADPIETAPTSDQVAELTPTSTDPVEASLLLDKFLNLLSQDIFRKDLKAVDEKGQNILHYLAKQIGNPTLTESEWMVLLNVLVNKEKIDINALSSPNNSDDSRTPLQLLLARQDDFPICALQALIDNGANPKIFNKYSTLYVVMDNMYNLKAKYDQERPGIFRDRIKHILNILVQAAGHDFIDSSVPPYKSTLLHFVAKRGLSEIITMLIKDFNVDARKLRDDDGLSVLNVWSGDSGNKFDETAELLVFDELLEIRDNVNRTPYISFCKTLDDNATEDTDPEKKRIFHKMREIRIQQRAKRVGLTIEEYNNRKDALKPLLLKLEAGQHEQQEFHPGTFFELLEGDIFDINVLHYILNYANNHRILIGPIEKAGVGTLTNDECFELFNKLLDLGWDVLIDKPAKPSSLSPLEVACTRAGESYNKKMIEYLKAMLDRLPNLESMRVMRLLLLTLDFSIREPHTYYGVIFNFPPKKMALPSELVETLTSRLNYTLSDKKSSKLLIDVIDSAVKNFQLEALKAIQEKVHGVCQNTGNTFLHFLAANVNITKSDFQQFVTKSTSQIKNKEGKTPLELFNEKHH